MKTIRLTIVKKKKYKRKQKQIALIVFVLAPLISIILGYVITTNIIAPYLNKEPQEIENTQLIEENENKTLNSIEIYSVEVDRFDSLEKAKKLILKLNKLEKLGYISQEEEEYIVYSALTLDKEEAESQETIIKEKYPQSLVKTVEVIEKDMDIDISEALTFESIKEIVNLLEVSYRDELELWIQDIKDTDYDILKTKIDENNIKLAEAIEKYAEEFGSRDIKNKDLTEIYSNLEKNIASRKVLVEEFNNKRVEDIRKTYYDYVETLFNYVNYYKISN